MSAGAGPCTGRCTSEKMQDPVSVDLTCQLPAPSFLPTSMFLPGLHPLPVAPMAPRLQSLPYRAAEGDGYFLASQRPPPLCAWQPPILQDVLSRDDVLSAELLGQCHLCATGADGPVSHTSDRHPAQEGPHLPARPQGQRDPLSGPEDGPAPRQSRGPHVHVSGGDGGDGRWHQHCEWARCGDNLLAALLWKARERASE